MANASGTREGAAAVLKFFEKFAKGLEAPYTLALDGFGIINIPNLEKVKSLTTMSFTRNALKKLDKDLFWDKQYNVAWHQRLTTIDISANHFVKFPEILTRLVTLCDIDVSDNQISVLPPELRYLTRLTTVKASGCPLSSPPMTVVDDG